VPRLKECPRAALRRAPEGLLRLRAEGAPRSGAASPGAPQPPTVLRLRLEGLLLIRGSLPRPRPRSAPGPQPSPVDPALEGSGVKHSAEAVQRDERHGAAGQVF
jgi:hypothetical protein